ncbi:MAG: MnhB domain-containing protein [Lysobacterales bacterium]|jgi:multicomponent Na+:H+ antiporter subunit B
MLPEGNPGMGTFLKTVTRWMKGPILLFGIYIILYGHVAPGGGFGGGVVIASAFVLMTLAYGEPYTLEFFSRDQALTLACLGLLIFVGLAWSGTWAGSGVFFDNLTAGTGGHRDHLFLTALEIGSGLFVSGALFMGFSVLMGHHEEDEE